VIPPPSPPKNADQPERPDVKYLPRQCPFLSKEVWAILTKQAAGPWKIVNCLDKHECCFEYNCAFTVDGGAWPFGDVTVGRR
jgi:hypothetical protein